MSDRNSLPILAAFAVGIAFLILVFLFLPASQDQPRVIHPTPVPFTFVEDLPKQTISAEEAVLVARDDLDKRAQISGDKAGEYRGGPLGSIELLYTHQDGKTYILNRYDGSFDEEQLYFEHMPRDTYYWIIELNYESEPDRIEYVFTINAETREIENLSAS